jgi:hypothetical protein
VRRQHQLATAARKQLLGEIAFEQLELLADGAVGDAKFFGGGRQTAMGLTLKFF